MPFGNRNHILLLLLHIHFHTQWLQRAERKKPPPQSKNKTSIKWLLCHTQPISATLHKCAVPDNTRAVPQRWKGGMVFKCCSSDFFRHERCSAKSQECWSSLGEYWSQKPIINRETLQKYLRGWHLNFCSMDSQFSDKSFKKPVHNIVSGIYSGTHTCSCNELLSSPVQHLYMKIINIKKYCQEEVLCALLTGYTQPHTDSTKQLILKQDTYTTDKSCSSGWCRFYTGFTYHNFD